MKIIYTTDLHGNPDKYERFLKEAGKKDIDAVIIGGDITPVGFINLFIQAQRDFLEKYLLPRFKQFRKETGKPLFIMMGNDDFRVNMDVLEKGGKQGVLKLMNQKIHKLKGFQIVGYSYINETPFLLKDWEKKEDEIKRDLEKLAKRVNPRKTVFVFHAPPLNTDLDILYNASHVGSRAVQEFIEKHHPLLTLHGHIHESPRMSGSFKEKIGKSLCINPGNEEMISIDLNTLNTRLIKFD